MKNENGLRFNPRFRVERLPPNLVFLLAENEQHILSGDAYYALAPLLDGTRDEAGLVAVLNGVLPPMQVGYTLNRLRAKGYLAEDEAPAAIAFTVRLVALTAAPLDALVNLLTAEGITLNEDADLDLVVVDDDRDPRLEAFNRTAKRLWMLVKPVGSVVWLGPVFEPQSAPCWACLSWRIQYNFPVEAFLSSKLERMVTPPVSDQPSAVGVSLIARMVAAWRDGDTRLRNHVYTYDTRALDVHWHPLIARPNCPVCGDPAVRQAAPITLNAVPKASTGSDAGYRHQSAEDVYRRFQHHISGVCGIVTHITRVQSPPHIYVYASGHNKSRSFEHWQNFRRSLRSQSAGKGTSEIQARASALCEAIERYSGMFHGDEPRVTAAYDQLDDAVHPHELLLFSACQYAQRETWNAACPPHLVVPDPFDASRPIEWSPAWSLTDQTFRHVPTAYCYYDYALPDDHIFCGADSNGCAAGSTLEDAVLQGFLELVERESVALWWYHRLRRPAFDLDAIDHPYLQQVRAFFATISRELWVLDLTADLGIPACVAVSRRVDAPTEDIVLGFGAHLDPQIAVLRAVTELNQSLPAALRDASGAYQSESPWEIDWWQHTRIADQPYLVPDESQPKRTPRDYPVPHHDDLLADVQWCVERARAHSLDVLVIDQTRADAGLPVARVIVPGMRHFWARFAPGRLYDVPVALGWQTEPTPESDLNDKVMFL